jgi:hypothetical protein
MFFKIRSAKKHCFWSTNPKAMISLTDCGQKVLVDLIAMKEIIMQSLSITDKRSPSNF